jgi:hypothetical protein
MEETMEVDEIITENAGIRHSQTLGELAKALALASLEFESAVKAAENPFFSTAKKKAKYADLAELIRVTRPALGKNGLVVVQTPYLKEHAVQVTTMLLHGSGEWLANDLELPADQTIKFEENGRKVTKFDGQGRPIMKFDPQTVGSAISYARRYAYQSILNIAGEEDDDANAASVDPRKTAVAAEEEYSQIPEYEQRISQSQINSFWDLAKKMGKTNEQVSAYLETMGYLQVENLKKGQFNDAIKWAGKVNSPETAEKMTSNLKDSVLLAKSRKAFAAAKKKGLVEADLRLYIEKAFEIKSFKELSSPQWDRIIEHIDGREAIRDGEGTIFGEAVTR